MGRIQTKRVYEAPAPDDGERFLVDRAVEILRGKVLDPRTKDFNYDLFQGKEALTVLDPEGGGVTPAGSSAPQRVPFFQRSQRLGELDPAIDLRVFRNDRITVDEIAALGPTHIIVSPGPCTPREAGISNDVLKRFAPKIGADVKRFLTPEGSVAARKHVGGTAPAQVKAAIARARKRLAAAD